MLFQLHWQFGDRTTEMKAQSEIDTNEEMKIWHNKVAKKHPLPKGAIWMVCNEKSKHFVIAVA